ncbi:patatin-like phospholipase family protein [soil metagenome]
MLAVRLQYLLLIACVLPAGCAHRNRTAESSPVTAGLNTRDLIDPNSQIEYERRTNTASLVHQAERIREMTKPATPPPKRSVLCLSGGGSFGAYSAGILNGWTARGDRPEFAVVTGISTGALCAPCAFLGPRYDAELKRFFTTSKTRDIYKLKPIRGLMSESMADNSPLARQMDDFFTPQVVAEIAIEHSKGRRLFVGTTELEGKRFVMWNIGEIACRGRPQDTELIKQILLGSSAIPGFFPAAHIPVEVDGRRYIERHVDGGVSQALFFQPPYVTPDLDKDKDANSLWGTDVNVVIAGKLYADPETMKERALSIGGKSVSTILYAQTRGDLVRLWTASQLSGMDFRMTAIPAEFQAPSSATDFDPVQMTRIYNEGFRLARDGTAWRKTPPGVEFGETLLSRDGTELTVQPRGPAMSRPQSRP